MKKFITLLLVVMSFSVKSEDICFKEIKPHLDNKNGQVITGAYTGISIDDKKYNIAFSYVRCMCLSNEVTNSINLFLKNSQNYSLENLEVCLINPKSWNNDINSADGFYLKRK